MWNEKQVNNVAELLRCFNGADEVVAVTGCSHDDLDPFCMEAFKCSFEQAKDAFAAQGRAMVRQSLMTQVMEGNMKAIDMVAREQLGMGAVESRMKTLRNEDAKTSGEESQDQEDEFLTLIQGRRRTAQG